MLMLAWPPDIITGAPKLLPSTLNWTVPVGVPAPGAAADTVAVMVMDWPNTEGLAEEASDAVELAWLTVCVIADDDDVLPLKLVSPPYTAVILCDPTDSDVVLKVAVPEPSVPVPRVVDPSMNVTVPVGVPAPGATAATVAVNVTLWPKTDGLIEDETDVLVLP